MHTTLLLPFPLALGVSCPYTQACSLHLLQCLTQVEWECSRLGWPSDSILGPFSLIFLKCIKCVSASGPLYMSILLLISLFQQIAARLPSHMPPYHSHLCYTWFVTCMLRPSLTTLFNIAILLPSPTYTHQHLYTLPIPLPYCLSLLFLCFSPLDHEFWQSSELVYSLLWPQCLAECLTHGRPLINMSKYVTIVNCVTFKNLWYNKITIISQTDAHIKYKKKMHPDFKALCKFLLYYL